MNNVNKGNKLMSEHKKGGKTGLIWSFTILLIILTLWSVLSLTAILPPTIVPSPFIVANSFFLELNSGRLIEDLIASLFRITTGYALAVITGIPMGLWLGLNPTRQAAILPFVNFFRNLSPLTWIPFAILWFGIGDLPAIFLIFMTAFFPLVLATVAAVASIPATYFRVANEYKLNSREILLQITLPAIQPQIITALRMTAGLSWLVLVAAEMIAGRDGLGYAVWDARNGLRIDLLIVQMLVIGTMGIVIDKILLRLTKNPRVQWSYAK
jgi:NitT/TauT family transport system permease protein